MPLVTNTETETTVQLAPQGTLNSESTGMLDRTLFRSDSGNWIVYAAVILLAAAVYLACVISPPSLQDDVDAVQAQIARNMIISGDWVSARLDGIPYLEKPPLLYWLIALSYKVFGVQDWAARLPIALTAIGLCWLTAAFGIWAFGKRAGFYAGVCMATCLGLWMFTRVLIPDVMLAFTIALAMWSFLRVLDEDEQHPRRWAYVLAACIGAGLLLKSLIGVVFPVAAGLIYLALTHQLFLARTWKRLHPFTGALIVLAIAAPWHVLATLRNPPYFDFTLRSVPGEYHGFLWFFFINEQLLRFLNLRYPPDYATVPRVYFWLFHLAWLFPWSVYFPATAQLSYKPDDRAGKTRLLALCWIGFILVFFTFSTTQEYYSMPCYPAMALLLGSAMAAGGKWIQRGNRVLTVLLGVGAAVVVGLLLLVRNVPTPGDISVALTQQANYKLSLGHMNDLTVRSLAYMRVPLVVAMAAALLGFFGLLNRKARQRFLAPALAMVLFFQAARLAMVVLDPYLSSRPLAEALLRSPEGQLIVNRHYYPFSSIFFYTNRSALLLNGRVNNLVYGSYAPGAPNVFLDEAGLARLWTEPNRVYLAAPDELVPHLNELLQPSTIYTVIASGGKVLLSNQPMPAK